MTRLERLILQEFKSCPDYAVSFWYFVFGGRSRDHVLKALSDMVRCGLVERARPYYLYNSADTIFDYRITPKGRRVKT